MVPKPMESSNLLLLNHGVWDVMRLKFGNHSELLRQLQINHPKRALDQDEGK